VDPYIDVADAQTYFDERLRTDPWDDAEDSDKLKALKMATRMIDKLNFAGCKHDEDQELQFPRGDDTEVPQDIKDATCELALALLDDVDPNLEVENLSHTKQGIGDARVERDTTFSDEHIRAGIPSIDAWNLLKPYLRDPREVGLLRS
jgi:hypothetical protein